METHPLATNFAYIRQGFFEDIIRERKAQDTQWGGHSHDTMHSFEEWLEYMQHQVNKARAEENLTGGSAPDSRRERLVKIAALCLAAVQAGCR